MGWSDRRIARKLGVAASTLGSRLRDWQPPPVSPPPVQQPVISQKPVLPAPMLKPAPVPVSEPVLPPDPPPAPYGLPGVEPGTKAFFLVRGERNAAFARSYNQIALGIDRWHEAYRDLPCFRDAERIWVVVDTDEDHRAFILSIASDLMIREKSLISREGIPRVCGGRLRMVRARRFECETEEQLLRGFEEIHHFQPVPLPTHTDKLAALAAQEPDPDKPNSFGGSFGADEEWRRRWS